jgi:hypothetical protein
VGPGCLPLSDALVQQLRTRDRAPWNGRHLALGVEPICAVFDLGAGASTRAAPISALDTPPTAVQFHAGVTHNTQYRLSAEAIQ